MAYVQPGHWYHQGFSDEDLYFFGQSIQKNGGVAGIHFTVEKFHPRKTPKPKKGSVNKAWFDLWKEVPASSVPEKVLSGVASVQQRDPRRSAARDSHSEHARNKCPPGWKKTRKIAGCYSPEEERLSEVEDSFHSKAVYREHIRGRLAGYLSSEEDARMTVKAYASFIDHGWKEHASVGQVFEAILKHREHRTAHLAKTRETKKGFFASLFGGRDPSLRSQKLASLNPHDLNQCAFLAWSKMRPLGTFKREFTKRGWDLAIIHPKTNREVYRWRSS